jgi:hypothetical protein
MQKFVHKLRYSDFFSQDQNVEQQNAKQQNVKFLIVT